MEQLNDYTVTAGAPDEIYGKRVAKGDTVSLTAEQAANHLRREHIVAKGAAKATKAHAPKAKD